MSNKRNFYIKIIVVLILGFILAKYISPEIFMANTPKIRPNLGGYLAMRVNNLMKDNIQFLANIFYRPPSIAEVEKKLTDVSFKPVASGVYAKSRGNMTYTVINKDEIEWIEYTFNVNGREIKINVPKGQEPPSQDVVEKMH